jgi:hypothetical protein
VKLKESVYSRVKGAGFTDESILIVICDESDREYFLRQAAVRVVSDKQIPSLPELSAAQNPVLIEAKEKAENALNILDRHHPVTAAVPVPAA